MSRLFENISDSILKSLNESVYQDNKKVKNAKKQYDIESFKKPRIMRGTVDTENVGSTKSIEKKIERTPYKRPHKATKKVVAECDGMSEKEVNESIEEGNAYFEMKFDIAGVASEGDPRLLDIVGGIIKNVASNLDYTQDAPVRDTNGKVIGKYGFGFEGVEKAISESENLKEADSPFVDNLISDIEDGMFSWETIARACLKYMSEMDIRDMCRSNEFYNMDDLDEEAKGEKENGGYKVDEQIYKISQVLIPEVEGLSNKLKEKIDYLENRENKSDREQVELEKLKSAYKSFGDALNSMKAVKEDS